MAESTFHLPRLFWLWVPLAGIIAQIIIEIFVPEQYLGAIHSEWGPHETLQFIIIFWAFVITVLALPKIDWVNQRLLGIWFAIAAVCCLYVAGEELSWGQQIFRWGTPEFWLSVNDQEETNLHNTSSWLDQKPRLILLLGILTGGLVIPFLRKYRPTLLPPAFTPIYPPSCLWLVALLSVVPQLVEKGAQLFDVVVFSRVSEVQELFMFYFVLLYLWELRKREISKV